MNEPPLDRNENMIDIFILSISESIAQQFTEPLEEKGYRVTLFSDSTRLFEILRKGKPNLLICDTTSVEDGFDVCRRIKADNDLWVIPVLIFTSASTLTDLLNVLDCNAENFLAFPSDIPYRLSLIETTITTPVERQTPELIKTQFKINHEDRIYVVSASRRKILELLLSSFEIAVNKSSELSELKMEIQRLKESAETLKESVTEHTCVIDLLNATNRTKDQKITALTNERSEKDQIIAQKIAEIKNIKGELDTKLAFIAQKEDEIRSLIREKEEIETFHRSETDALRQQVSGLSTKINTLKTRLDSVQREFEEEKTHCISLETTLREITTQKDLAETSYNNIISEYETLKTAFESSKVRLNTAEQEKQALIDARTQSEQDLNEKITVLEQTLKETGEVLTQLSEKLETERNERILREEQLKSTWQEKERLESLLASTSIDLNRQLDVLQDEYRTARATLETKENMTKSLERDLASSVADKEKSEEQLRAVQASYETSLAGLNQELAQANTIRAALEKDLAASVAEKEKSEEQLRAVQTTYETSLASLNQELVQANTIRAALEKDLAASVADKEKSEEQLRAVQASYETSLAGLNQELVQANTIRAALETDLETVKTQIRTYTEELELANKGSTEYGQRLRMLETELDLTRKTLEEKENLVKSLRDDLAGVALEKEKTDGQIRADIESYKTTFIRLKHDLDETLASRRMLERDLALANHTKDQAEQQSRLLGDELRRVKAEFEHEQRLHLASDQSLRAVEENRKRFEEDLRISADNLTSLKEQLEDERKARLIAEEKSISADLEKKRLEDELRTMTEKWDHQEQDRAVKFQNLKKDLETVCDLQKSLEEEVIVLNEEKLKAEQKVQDLTRELAQARTALADEWEDHMTSDERLAAAVLEQQRLKKSLSQSYQPGTEEIVQEIIAKEPDLPVKIDQTSQSLELVIQPKAQTAAEKGEHGTPEPPEGSASQDMRIQDQNLSGIEDLYESDEQAPLPGQESEHVSGGTEEEILQESRGSDEEKEDLRAEGDIYGETKSGEPEQTLTGTYDSVGTVPSPAFSFNRRQWLSLIKWAHHSEALSRDQRLQIIRMGRLIQKNRRLTREQEVQVREMVALVQALGYKPE